MKAQEISEQIINHPDFANLDFVQQERITAPPFSRWVSICINCMSFDRDRTINLVMNVQWLDPAFRPIFLDILNRLWVNTNPGDIRVGDGNQIQLFQ